MKEMTPSAALKRLASLCAKREYCTGDLNKKLLHWGIDEQDRAAIIAKLVEAQYVDDERYARMFIRDKIEMNGWGRRKIEQALYAKRIDSAISRPILDEYDAASYTEKLLPLLRGKLKTVKAASDYERYSKLMRFALSRGFGYDIARRCIEQLGIEATDSE